MDHNIDCVHYFHHLKALLKGWDRQSPHLADLLAQSTIYAVIHLGYQARVLERDLVNECLNDGRNANLLVVEC